MLQKENFNGKVLIFPLLEIEFQNISVNIEKADILDNCVGAYFP